NAVRPNPNGSVIRLLDDFDASYSFVANIGPVFYFLTNLDAPRYRLIAIDTRQPARANWRDVIPQGSAVLDGVSMVGGRFVADWMEDAHSRLTVYETDGRRVADIPLPTVGTASGLNGRADNSEGFFSFTSYLYPTTIY